MKICFATNNAHKLQEVREILGERFHVVSLNEAGFEGEIPETHETLEENSEEKAQYIFQKLNIPVFSDDSGLEVKALSGKPGVHTAHYAGTRDAKNNMSKVLAELGQENDRMAQFRSVMTFVNSQGQHQFEGIVEGSIAHEMSGADGFGYDPIFIPKGSKITFAEMSAEAKNEISHRKRAVEKLANFLNSLV